MCIEPSARRAAQVAEICSPGGPFTKTKTMWFYEHIEESDFNHPTQMNKLLLAKLDLLLEYAKVDTIITSDFRPEDPKSHGSGDAVDLSAETSRIRYKLIRAALAAGFKRIGIYPTHIHVDVSPTRDQDVIWLWSPKKEEV